MISNSSLATTLTMPSERELVITRTFDAPRRLVFKDGRVVARTEPATHVVNWKGEDRPVDFQPPTRAR